MSLNRIILILISHFVKKLSGSYCMFCETGHILKLCHSTHIVKMLGSEAARTLNRDYNGASVHRRGITCRGMYLDSHIRIQDNVIIRDNMCPNYLQSLGTELAVLDKEVYDEFFYKVSGEIDRISPQGRQFGSCPMLLDETNCPILYRQVRETTMHAVVRNFMCKFDRKYENEMS